MSENKNELYPDISGLFDIDDKDIPAEIIEKAPVSEEIKKPILNSDEALKTLPKASRKAIAKDKKQRKRKNQMNKARKKIITAASVVLAVIIAFGFIGYLISEHNKPSVTCEKPVKESISIHTDAIGVTYTDTAGMNIVFIDNEYDTHKIEAGQKAELVTAELKTTGTVFAIKEELPESDLITNHYSVLASGSLSADTPPETAVYAVYIRPDNAEEFTAAGKPVSVKVHTLVSEDTLTVPSSAVITDETGTYVWVYSVWTKSVSGQPVTTGIVSDGKTEITSGLKKSSRVVISGEINELADGVKVKVK